MTGFQQAIDHDLALIAAEFSLPPVQFIPGVTETPQERYLRKLEECGAGPKALAKNWAELQLRHPWLRSVKTSSQS